MNANTVRPGQFTAPNRWARGMNALYQHPGDGDAEHDQHGDSSSRTDGRRGDHRGAFRHRVRGSVWPMVSRVRHRRI